MEYSFLQIHHECKIVHRHGNVMDLRDSFVLSKEIPAQRHLASEGVLRRRRLQFTAGPADLHPFRPEESCVPGAS